MLVRKLASVRQPTDAPEIRYDPERHITMVKDPCAGWVPSYESSETSRTKKADIETGEDQKGQ